MKTYELDGQMTPKLTAKDVLNEIDFSDRPHEFGTWCGWDLCSICIARVTDIAESLSMEGTPVSWKLKPTWTYRGVPKWWHCKCEALGMEVIRPSARTKGDFDGACQRCGHDVGAFAE